MDTEQVLLLCLLSDLSGPLAVNAEGCKGPRFATKASHKHLSWETKTQSAHQMLCPKANRYLPRQPGKP